MEGACCLLFGSFIDCKLSNSVDSKSWLGTHNVQHKKEMKKLPFLILIGFTLLTSHCKQDDPVVVPIEIINEAGTYYNTITTSNGQEREFIVYIPPSAEGQKAVPILLVIHGTNQNGQIFYENPNLWNPKAEEKGFIVVYPTALIYCHYDNGVQRTTTKWAAGDLGQTNVNLGALPLCPDEELQDDMLFFDELISDIKREYVVDTNRLYITGFSNGAQMAARLAAQRPDVFAAATVHAGNLSKFVPTTLSSRPMSMIVTVGASDPLFMNSIGATSPVSVDSNAINNPGVMDLLEPFLEVNGLDSQYNYSSAQYYGKDIAEFIFQTSNVGLDNKLRFILIEDLEHSYTNILIDPFWTFLEEITLP